MAVQFSPWLKKAAPEPCLYHVVYLGVVENNAGRLAAEL